MDFFTSARSLQPSLGVLPCQENTTYQTSNKCISTCKLLFITYILKIISNKDVNIANKEVKVHVLIQYAKYILGILS